MIRWTIMRYLVLFLLCVLMSSKEFHSLYVKNQKYHLSCAYGLHKEEHLCLTWFLKAKISGELPSTTNFSSNKSLEPLTSYFIYLFSVIVCVINLLNIRLFDFETICSESEVFTLERLSFLTDRHEFEHNKNCMPIVGKVHFIPLRKIWK